MPLKRARRLRATSTMTEILTKTWSRLIGHPIEWRFARLSHLGAARTSSFQTRLALSRFSGPRHLCHGRSPETIWRVIVDHAGCLHPGVDDYRTHELEATLLQSL